MDSLVEGSLTWSALRRSDIAAVAELREAIDYLDDSIDPSNLPPFEERLGELGDEPSPDAVVGRDRGDTIVAYGWNVVRQPAEGLPQIWIDGGVHPGWRHRHIGSRILAWQTGRAEEWLRTRATDTPDGRASAAWVGTYVDTRVASCSHLLAGGGLLPERWYQDLHASLGHADLRPPRLVLDTRRGRVVLAPYQADRDEEVRLLHNGIFERLAGDVIAAGGPAGAEQETWEASWQRDSARPQWSWIALADDEIIGYALNSECPVDADGVREGWTDRLGVAFSWRGLGVGSALLRASRHSFATDGLEHAGVGIDTTDPEQTLRALHATGYVESDTVVLYSARLELDAAGVARWEAPGRLG